MLKFNLEKLTKHPLFKGSIIMLFIAVIIFPMVGIISLYYHEQAHIKKAQEYKINLVYNFSFRQAYISYWTMGFKPYASGISRAATEEDDAKYKTLDIKYKKEINLAGIKSDYNFINAILLGILLTNLLFFFKKFREKTWIYFIVYVDIILFYWLWHLITATSLNLFNPGGDLQKLFY